MRNIFAFAFVIAVAVTVTACSSSSPAAPAKPKISAATACKDFTSWYLSVSGNMATTKNLAELQTAVSAAPSGQLYQDLSTVESDVETTAGASGSLATAESLMTKEAALSAAQDCDAVNPNS